MRWPNTFDRRTHYAVMGKPDEVFTNAENIHNNDFTDTDESGPSAVMYQPDEVFTNTENINDYDILKRTYVLNYYSKKVRLKKHRSHKEYLGVYKFIFIICYHTW